MEERVAMDTDCDICSVQEQGVMATIKHLVGNEQEMWRMYNPFQPAYSANIGQ
jgi:hypothetical protein